MCELGSWTLDGLSLQLKGNFWIKLSLITTKEDGYCFVPENRSEICLIILVNGSDMHHCLPSQRWTQAKTTVFTKTPPILIQLQIQIF
jgi:hypothetical protein